MRIRTLFAALAAALTFSAASLQAQATIVGQSCGPNAPAVFSLGVPAPGETFQFGVDGPANAPTVLFVGLPGGPLPLGLSGCALHIDLATFGTVPLTTDAAGNVTLSGMIPLSQPIGSELAFQFAFLDGGPFFGISLSDALRVQFLAAP